MTPRSVARQTPLPMKFSRQEYCGVWPFPTSGDLPYPGIKPRSPELWADFLLSEPPEEPLVVQTTRQFKRPFLPLSEPNRCLVLVTYKASVFQSLSYDTDNQLMSLL